MNHTVFSKRKTFFWTSLLVLAMLSLAACQPAATPTVAPTAAAPASTSTTAPAATATTVVPATGGNAAGEATVNVANDSMYGQILVDGKGMTLYAFANDGPDTSNCTGACAQIWPPLLSQGSPKAGPGVDQSMLGTATLADGSKIVTYNHMPLYTYSKDQNPGQATGQGFKGIWFVVSPDGQMNKTGMPTATPAAGYGSTAGGAMINLASDPTLGKFLVDGAGKTLYMFKKDEPDKSNCTGNCLKSWPAFTASGQVTAGSGVDQSLIGTATLADGTEIVTYNHMPLYYFAKDQNPGDMNGQEINNVWYIVSPDGKAIENPSSMGSTPGASNAAGDVQVNVINDPKLGQILVDSQGLTLYIFTKDGPNQSNCTGGCLKAWPPLTVSGAPKAGTGVDQSLLGTATLADGSKIVTYNHMPLYHWAGDVKSGDTNGQGVQNVWFVVGPDGKPVSQSSSSSGSSY